MGGSTVIIYYLSRYGGIFDLNLDPWNNKTPKQRDPQERSKMISDFPELESLLGGWEAYSFISHLSPDPQERDLDLLYGIARFHNIPWPRIDAVEKLSEHKYDPDGFWEIFLHDNHNGVRRAAYEAFYQTPIYRRLYNDARDLIGWVTGKQLTKVNPTGLFK